MSKDNEIDLQLFAEGDGQTPPPELPAGDLPAGGGAEQGHEALRKALETGGIEKTLETVLSLRGEAATNRKEADALKAQLAELAKFKETAEKKMAEEERAKLSEQERLKADLAAIQKERDALAAERDLEKVNSAIVAAVVAGKLSPHDMGDVSKFLDRSKIKIGPEGVTGVAEALDALVKAKPYLFGSQSQPGTVPAPPGGPQFGGKGQTATEAMIAASLNPSSTEGQALKKYLKSIGL